MTQGPHTLPVSEGSKIAVPKRFMQTWKDYQVPEHWSPSPESVKRLHPDWDYHLMSDEDNRAFVAHHFPQYLQTYDELPYPIMRVDMVRYCWLYVNGGVYMDLDSELTSSLEPLLQKGELFLAQSPNASMYLTNSLMASRAGHPLWLDVLEAIKAGPPIWATTLKHLHVMAGSGPYLLDQVVKSKGHRYTLLPPELVSAYSLCDDTSVDKGAILRPLQGCSWGGADTRFLNTCYCQKWLICLLLVLVPLALLWPWLTS